MDQVYIKLLIMSRKRNKNLNKKRRQDNNKNRFTGDKKKEKYKYIRAYKKYLASKGHPKETSKPDPKLIQNNYPLTFDPPDDDSIEEIELENEILQLENLYGFGTRKDSQGNIITPEGKVIGQLAEKEDKYGRRINNGKEIIGRHYE